MKTPLPDIHKIAVFRALQLGDLLCVIPAIRALRKAYPDAEICLLGLPWSASLPNRFPAYFDRFIHFPGYTGLPEQPYDEQRFLAFLEKMLDEQFDLLLQMQGNGTIVNWMLKSCGARMLAGFHNKESHVPSPLFLPYPEEGPEIDRHLKLMEHLGIPSAGRDLEFPVNEAEAEELRRLALPIRAGKYVCLHPGSRGAWRQWPPVCFAALGNYCIEQGLPVVITGTSGETEIANEVQKYMRYPAINLCGKTSLGAVGALIGEAALLIANCTGVSHIAAATKTPSLIISMDGEPERWGPVDRELHHVIDWTKEQNPGEVFRALRRLLDGAKDERTTEPLRTAGIFNE